MANRVRRFVALLISLSFLAAGAWAQKAPRPLPPQGLPGQVHTGLFRGRQVKYQVVNGRMIAEGDIGLDRVDHMLPGSGARPSATLAYLQYRWPKVGSLYQIPYTIDSGSGDTANINAAIAQYNSIFAGVIQWVPWTTQTDYIHFFLDPNDQSGQGNSYIGRTGGPQLIWGSGSCTVATLLHEMGHATGLWHEQSRPDSAAYVNIDFDNIINVEWYASTQQFDDMQEPTLYDWSSIMHYGAFTFSKNGKPTHESIPPGMPLSNNNGYSASDVDGIKRLYQAIPTGVTITSNPVGLQVIVDGSTITTPKTFNWPLQSAHTLATPANAQTLNSVGYTYGRWNDDGAQSHSITVLPGNGTLARPSTAPGVTVYEASFIQLVPYASSVYPTGTGTVTPNPAPQAYSGLTGVYYVARQPVTLTATPSAGQSFYQYINSPYWLPGGLSINPKTFYVMDDGNPINTTAYFAPASSPIYTFGSSPEDSSFYVILDGGYWPAPVSFSPFYDSTWNVGTGHTIAVDATQWPYSINSRYQFGNWTDGGAQSHGIVMPSTSRSYTAMLSPQYYLSAYANQPCAGTVNVTPSSPTGDGYYPSGTNLSFSESPAAGWTFTEWQNNLSGTGSTANLTMNDELLVTADYNTTATPLTVTSLSPAAAVSGSGNFTLTINGTGFTNGTIVFVNNVFRANTFVSANKLTVAMTSADLATPGAFQIFVENLPNGYNCAAYQALPFTVANGPILRPSPLSLAFGRVYVIGAAPAKTIRLKNTSNSTLTIHSVTSTNNYVYPVSSGCYQIPHNGTCSFTVSFSPTLIGSVPGSITINDDAPDAPQIISLTGTGVAPLSLSPATIAFGTQAVGTTSAAKVVSLTNNTTGTLPLSLSTSGNFAVGPTGTTCGASLAAGAKCNVALTFTPTSAASIFGTLAINDNWYGPQVVGLFGTGSGGSASPLAFSPANMSFSTVPGTMSVIKTLSVKNVSASALTLSSVAVTPGFIVNGTSATCMAGLTLPAGGRCSVSVVFSPAFGAAGSVTGAIVFTDNASVGQQAFDLKGTGLQPFTLSPTSLTFGTQAVGTASATQTVTLTNNFSTSEVPAITSSAEYIVTPSGTSPCSGSIVTQASCTFTVAFKPSAVGTRASGVAVANPRNAAVVTLPVTGSGQ